MSLCALRRKMRCPICGSRRLAVRTYVEGSRLDALVLIEKAGGLDYTTGRTVQATQMSVAEGAIQPIECRDCGHYSHLPLDYMPDRDNKGEGSS